MHVGSTSSAPRPPHAAMSLAAVMQCCPGRVMAAACLRGRLAACSCSGGGRSSGRIGERAQQKRSNSNSSRAVPPPTPPPLVGAASTAEAPAAGARAGTAHLSPFADRSILTEKLMQTAKDILWGDLPHERPKEASKEQIQELQARLGYRFKNLYLLRLALIHSSAAPNTHNSIMAWIGDAALYLILSEEVAAAMGYTPIGKLSEVRKTLIGRAMCEKYASHLGLAPYLVMGKSVRVQNDGKASSNMVAEMFEAVMGAIYLDGDLEAVRRCYMSHFPLPADPLELLQPDGTGGMPSSSSGGGGDNSPWEQ